MTGAPVDVDQAAATIFEQVGLTRATYQRDPRNRGCNLRLLVLVGHQLWEDLCKRPEVNDNTGPWSDRDMVLRVVDAEVHPVDVPLVADITSWRLVRDVVVG